MSAINTGSIAKLLWPGLNAVWGREYTEYKPEWADLFDQETSDMAYEEDQLLAGFGLAPTKPEGQNIVYDSTSQGFTSRYTHVAYGLGFVITREAIDDNKYEKKALNSTKDLAFSLRQTKENVAANVYNRAFSASFPFGDGAALIANNHPTQAGNQSNVLAVAADLTETSIEDMCIQIMNAVNDRGLRISLMPKKLIVATANVFEAVRILKSAQQNDTANNATNALRTMGMFGDGACVNHYLSDSDAFFIRTNAPHGMKMFQRTAAEFGQDNDFDSSNLKYKGYERYSFGNTDFRGIFGTTGA